MVMGVLFGILKKTISNNSHLNQLHVEIMPPHWDGISKANFSTVFCIIHFTSCTVHCLKKHVLLTDSGVEGIIENF